jgi:hypothetical protein
MTTLPPSMYPQVSEGLKLLVCDVTSAARLKPKVDRKLDLDIFRAPVSLKWASVHLNRFTSLLMGKNVSRLVTAASLI